VGNVPKYPGFGIPFFPLGEIYPGPDDVLYGVIDRDGIQNMRERATRYPVNIDPYFPGIGQR
jgi:hypothetical protein